jgi:hypothetical protein
MTAFETASLAAAQGQMWAAIAMAIIALVAAIIAIKTLKQLVQQVTIAATANSIDQLNALLILEQDMSGRRARLVEIHVDLDRIQKSEAYKTDTTILEPIIRQFNEAQENYLNSLDRLCFCILRGKFSDDELRADYRDVVKRAIEDFPTHFTAASPFRNVLKIHNKWADS